jgi:hypothetical protein
MIDWVLVCISIFLAVEVFLRTSLKRNIGEMLDYTKRSYATITSKKVSDHWKEKVLPRYALRIFVNSFCLLFCLILAASPILVVDFIGKQFGANVLGKMMTPLGVGISIILASFYVNFRSKVLNVRL